MNMEAPGIADTRAIKEARTQHAVHPLITQRWSARAFTDEPVTGDQVRALIEAASWAPSAMNEQPWRYRVALKGDPWFDRLWECLNTGNKPWARNAGALLVCSGRTKLARNGLLNHAWQHDLGAANTLLLLQAVSMGIYGHLMGGFDAAKVNAVLGLDPAEEEVVCLLALGHLGHAEDLPEPFRTRELTPRTRRPVEETIVPLP